MLPRGQPPNSYSSFEAVSFMKANTAMPRTAATMMSFFTVRFLSGTGSLLPRSSRGLKPALHLRLLRGRSSDRHGADQHRGHADTDRHRLSVLAAGPAAVTELEVAADGG